MEHSLPGRAADMNLACRSGFNGHHARWPHRRDAYVTARPVLGSARASRAGGGALAIANFFQMFPRGRGNEHARARALPGKS